MRLGLNKRVRIRIFPAHTVTTWRNINKTLVMCLVILTFSMGFTYYHTQINPLIINTARQRMSQIVTTAINDVVNQYMIKTELSYEDLTIVQRRENGQIQALFMDTKNMNKIKSQLVLEIQKKIEDTKRARINIPFGAILDIPLFSGMGPMIDVEFVPIGYAKADFENSFLGAGINQTKHQIDIVIEASFGMILSAGSENVEIKTSVPVAQTIIVGELPEGVIKMEN
ncbi:MAG: sporulation protein YunB [Ruminococcaceae bacterium]|nr:sporulation protein YunB [Oscillospiraceae bacterium]